MQVFTSAFAYVNVRNHETGMLRAHRGQTSDRIHMSVDSPTVVQVNERLPFVWETR